MLSLRIGDGWKLRKPQVKLKTSQKQDETHNINLALLKPSDLINICIWLFDIPNFPEGSEDFQENQELKTNPRREARGIKFWGVKEGKP